jgi:hypothetical protein
MGNTPERNIDRVISAIKRPTFAASLVHVKNVQAGNHGSGAPKPVIFCGDLNFAGSCWMLACMDHVGTYWRRDCASLSM